MVRVLFYWQVQNFTYISQKDECNQTGSYRSALSVEPLYFLVSFIKTATQTAGKKENGIHYT